MFIKLGARTELHRYRERAKKSKNRMGLVTRPGRSWFRPWRSVRTRGVRCRKPVPVEAAAPGSDWGSLCTAGSGRSGSCQAAPHGCAGRDQQSQRQLSPWGFWPPGRTACLTFDRLFLDVFSKRSRSRWNLEFFLIPWVFVTLSWIYHKNVILKLIL